MRLGRNRFSARVTGWFVADLLRYFLEFNLIERNVYYCVFAGFDDDILERFTLWNSKLAIVLIFIKLGDIGRRDS